MWPFSGRGWSDPHPREEHADPPANAEEFGLAPIPIEGVAAYEREVWWRRVRSGAERTPPGGEEGARDEYGAPVPATEEVPYYAHGYRMASLSFRLRYVQTWIPERHFEPEATDPEVLEQVLAAFWGKIQRRFFEKLERAEVALRDLPYRSHEDVQDMDGTVYRAFYTVEASPSTIVVYTRARRPGITPDSQGEADAP